MRQSIILLVAGALIVLGFFLILRERPQALEAIPSNDTRTPTDSELENTSVGANSEDQTDISVSGQDNESAANEKDGLIIVDH